jgi:predicted O-linked N-acetylglucosamine transferase (SPINDLY family)
MLGRIKGIFRRGPQEPSARLQDEAAAAAADPVAPAQAARERGNAHLSHDRFNEAARCYEEAVALDPADAASLVNLGYVQCTLGLAAQARSHLERAVALEPGNHDAHYLLGTACEQSGDLQGAARSLQRTIELQPSFELAYRDLCRVLSQSGQLQEAKAAIEKGLGLNPGFADFHFYRGNLWMHEQEFTQAAASFLQALSIDSSQALVHASLGNAYERLDEWELAAASFQRALALSPGDAQTHNLLGTVQMKQGRLQDAVASYQHAIRLDPRHAEAHSNLGNALRIQGNFAAAVENCRRAVELQPDLPAAHNNLGAALASQDHDAEALQSFSTAVSLEPGNARYHGNCGGAFQRQGAVGQAVESYRKALTLDPRLTDVHSNLLFALSFSPECSPAQYLLEARRYGQTVRSMVAKPFDASSGRAIVGGRPLRVGLVSGDLRSHPVGFFLEGTLACLDPSRIELLAYSTQPKEDHLTDRIKPRFSLWRNIWGIGDANAARQVLEDKIDILVDLSGHSEHNRLPLFAWRSAPVQVSWLGFFASTGVSEIDYFLTDPVSTPEALRAQFSEQLWYLPHTRFCFTPPEPDSELLLEQPPVLRNGFVTFGSFQNASKMNSNVLKSWADILKALPSARLRVQGNHQALGDSSIRSRLAVEGIDPERVILAPASSRQKYLEAHREIDIILDTFPYPGGTTTCEALWMGVPTVTLAGNTLLARQGASLMACVGLLDWVAADCREYVRMAVGHAGNTNRLAQLRSSLRETALASPVFNARQFALDLQAAFEGMASRTR